MRRLRGWSKIVVAVDATTLERSDPSPPWTGLRMSCDSADVELPQPREEAQGKWQQDDDEGPPVRLLMMDVKTDTFEAEVARIEEEALPAEATLLKFDAALPTAIWVKAERAAVRRVSAASEIFSSDVVSRTNTSQDLMMFSWMDAAFVKATKTEPVRPRWRGTKSSPVKVTTSEGVTPKLA